MPANSDHIRRDAEHAARAEIALALGKFQRRILEEAKARISKELAERTVSDGTALGREAVEASIHNYLGPDDVTPAIEAEVAPSSKR